MVHFWLWLLQSLFTIELHYRQDCLVFGPMLLFLNFASFKRFVLVALDLRRNNRRCWFDDQHFMQRLFDRLGLPLTDEKIKVIYEQLSHYGAITS